MECQGRIPAEWEEAEARGLGKLVRTEEERGACRWQGGGFHHQTSQRGYERRPFYYPAERPQGGYSWNWVEWAEVTQVSAPGQWTGKGLVEKGVGFQLERVWQRQGHHVGEWVALLAWFLRPDHQAKFSSQGRQRISKKAWDRDCLNYCFSAENSASKN